MKKPMIFSAAILLIAALTAAALYEKEPPEISREKYPYAGFSMLSEEDYGSSAIVLVEPSFERTIRRAHGYVVGEFVTDVDNTKTITSIAHPKEGTESELYYKQLAEQEGKSYEEILPSSTYYEFMFKVAEDYGGHFQAGESIPVRVVVPIYPRSDKPIFPNVEAGTKAVLVIYIGFSTDTYYTGPDGFFYIDEYDRVISCESYPDYDKYTGTDIEDFKGILRESFETTEHIGATGPEYVGESESGTDVSDAAD